MDCDSFAIGFVKAEVAPAGRVMPVFYGQALQQSSLTLPYCLYSYSTVFLSFYFKAATVDTDFLCTAIRQWSSITTAGINLSLPNSAVNCVFWHRSFGDASQDASQA